MIDHGIGVQLNVDASVLSHPDVVRAWFLGLAEGVTRAELAGLADVPVRHPMASLNDPLATGEPGSPWGRIRIGRSHNGAYPRFTNRVPSRKGLAWLSDEVAELPYDASLEIGRYGDDRRVEAPLLNCALRPALDRDTDWLLFTAWMPTAMFVDPAAQRRWLDALYSVADRVGPGYGHISRAYDVDRTALEMCSPKRLYPAESARRAEAAMECNRHQLRGYSWLTIMAQEVADRLGGAEALYRSGAFAEVRQLAAGGVWLLATEDFRQYDMAAVEAVFDVVAPVLRPGLPVPRGPEFNDPPMMLVFEDPAERAARNRS